jgi:TonB family protein
MRLLRLVTFLSVACALVAELGAGQATFHSTASLAVPVVAQRTEAAYTWNPGMDVVLVKTRIAPDGNVAEVIAITPADPQLAVRFARLGRAAEAAVKFWRFQPPGADLTTIVGINFKRPGGVRPGQSFWQSPAESDPVGREVQGLRKIEDAYAIYPAGLQPAKNQPGVLVEMTIDADGNPVDAVPVGPVNELTAPAVDASLRWRFEAKPGVARRKVKVSVPFVIAASFGPPREQWHATRPEMFVDSRGFFQPARNTVLAKPIRQGKPRYSSEAMQRHQQGIVVIDALVGVDGTVEAAQITRSLPLLDQEALECVRHWTFTPMLVDGQPTPTVISLELKFTLR